MYGMGLKSRGSESNQMDQREGHFVRVNQFQAPLWPPSPYVPSSEHSCQDSNLDCARDLYRGCIGDRNCCTPDSPVLGPSATVDLSGPAIPRPDPWRNSNPLEPSQKTLAARVWLGLAGWNLDRRFRCNGRIPCGIDHCSNAFRRHGIGTVRHAQSILRPRRLGETHATGCAPPAWNVS